MTRSSQRFRYSVERAPAAVVVAVQERHQPAHELASSALELARLARVLGLLVVRTLVQERASAAAATLVSEGRLRELASLTGYRGKLARPEEAAGEGAHADDAGVVLFDCALSPGQQRALEQALGVEVLDRTALILRIFALRARTTEARLQVQLAQRLYDAPRIRDDHNLGDREGGGGRGGRGHSNVELKKQHNRREIAELRRQLGALGEREQVRRARREGLPLVALVGYTNAGKSSLMRALTGSEVLIEDALFATVGTTVRALSSATGPRLLVSDTVGFIANLPHELVASFRATLEEARHARLLLIVVDASDPDFREQLYVTQSTLRDIGAAAIPQRIVLNKADRLTRAQRAALTAELSDAIVMSAQDASEVEALRASLIAFFEGELDEGAFLVPYREGAVLGEMHEKARILEARHTPRGTHVRLRAARPDLARWQSALARPAHERRATTAPRKRRMGGDAGA